MPITIAQPEPVVPGLAAMGGMAEMYGRTLPELMQMQGRTTDILQNQIRFQQSQQLQQQQYQQQQALSQQHAQQQLAQELTIGEQNRMQRLMNAKSSVMMDDSLTDQEKQQYLGMIQQGLDPLQGRQQAMQQQAMKAHIDQQNQQVQQNADMYKRFSQLMGGDVPQGGWDYKTQDGRIFTVFPELTQHGNWVLKHVMKDQPKFEETQAYHNALLGIQNAKITDQRQKTADTNAEHKQRFLQAEAKAKRDEELHDDALEKSDGKLWLDAHKEAVKRAADRYKALTQGAPAGQGDIGGRMARAGSVMEGGPSSLEEFIDDEMDQLELPRTMNEHIAAQRQQRYNRRHPPPAFVGPPSNFASAVPAASPTPSTSEQQTPLPAAQSGADQRDPVGYLNDPEFKQRAEAIDKSQDVDEQKALMIAQNAFRENWRKRAESLRAKPRTVDEIAGGMVGNPQPKPPPPPAEQGPLPGGARSALELGGVID
jgi:hypothetical protein